MDGGAFYRSNYLHIMAQTGSKQDIFAQPGDNSFKSPVLLCVGGFIKLVLPMLI